MINLPEEANWEFVSLLLAALSIVISVIIFFAQRKYKSLSCEIVSETEIVMPYEECSEHLQILLQKPTHKQAHLVVAKLCNTGNLPIRIGDYEKSINLSITSSGKILSAEVVKTTPPNLPVTLQTTDKCTQLNPILLNRGDTVVIKMVIVEYKYDIKVDGRIVGIHKITGRDTTFWKITILQSLSLVPLILFMVLRKNRPPADPFLNALLLVFSVIFGATLFLDNRRS